MSEDKNNKNEKYFDQIKNILIEAGQDGSDIDNKAAAIVFYANQNNKNAIKLMEQEFDFNKLDSILVGLLNKFRPPTSFITKRVSERPTSKFIRRNIIE